MVMSISSMLRHCVRYSNRNTKCKAIKILTIIKTSTSTSFPVEVLVPPNSPLVNVEKRACDHGPISYPVPRTIIVHLGDGDQAAICRDPFDIGDLTVETAAGPGNGARDWYGSDLEAGDLSIVIPPFGITPIRRDIPSRRHIPSAEPEGIWIGARCLRY